MHPVQKKCVCTSNKLIGLFVMAYIPVFILQLTVYIIGTSIFVLSYLLYMTFLLAIHSSLYGLQSPILKNAIQRRGRKFLCLKNKEHSKNLKYYKLSPTDSSFCTLGPKNRIPQNNASQNDQDTIVRSLSAPCISLAFLKTPQSSRPSSCPLDSQTYRGYGSRTE